MGSKKSRKSPRALVSLVARYRSPTAFEFVSEECFDLSVGGMFIKSPSPAPSGTLLKLECDVDGGAAKIRGVARVVWLREQPSDGHPAGMGVKFVKLDPGGREVISSILDRAGGKLDESGESRRSQMPPTGTPEPFTRSPSSRPETVEASAGTPAQSRTRSGPSDVVTVRPPPGPLPLGAVSPELRARSDRSPATDPRPAAGSAAEPAARPAQAPVSGTSDTAPAHAERPGTGALRERLEQAKRQSSSHTASDPARAVATPVSRPARPETETTQPVAARPPSSRPFLYAAIALLAAGGVYALSNWQPAPASGVTAAAPELQPAADPQPAPAPQLPPAAPAQVAVAPADPTPAVAEPQAVVPTSIAPAEPRYLIEVVTKPEGARVSAGDRKAVAPAEFDLGSLATPISLKAELEGYQPASISVDRLGFMLDEGAMRRRIVLKLHEAIDPKAVEALEARRARRERAKQEAEEAEPKPAEPKPAEPVAEAKPEPTAAPTPSAPAPTPSAPAPAAELKPAPAPGETKAEPAQAPEKPKSSAKQKPLEAAMECLGAGDNECVVKALEGKAKTAQELELLIETYRTMGNAANAEKYMQVYVTKHPNDRRATAYRRVLENRQPSTPAP